MTARILYIQHKWSHMLDDRTLLSLEIGIFRIASIAFIISFVDPRA